MADKDKKEAKAAEVETEKPKIVKVRSKLAQKEDGGYPVALFEKDPAHPGGEVFIAGPRVVEAALTPAVKGALRDDKIEEVS